MSLAVPTFIPTLLLYGYGESTLIVSGFPAALTACSEFWNLADCLGYTVVFFPLGTTPYLNKCSRPALLMSLDIPIRVGYYIQPAGALVYDVTA